MSLTVLPGRNMKARSTQRLRLRRRRRQKCLANMYNTNDCIANDSRKLPHSDCNNASQSRDQCHSDLLTNNNQHLFTSESSSDPAIAISQEHTRALHLLHLQRRWSKLSVPQWHLDMKLLLRARESGSMNTNLWEPLDDFLETYLFEMEIQPLQETDAKAREAIKEGLLQQLHDAATGVLENCREDMERLRGER